MPYDLVFRAPFEQAALDARSAVAAGSLWGAPTTGATAITASRGGVTFLAVSDIPVAARDALEQVWPGSGDGWVLVELGDGAAALFLARETD